MLHGVKEVVERPMVAFRGLRTVDARFGDPREFVKIPDPEGLCLCATLPSGVIVKMGDDPRECEGFTFCVFVDKELKLQDWSWVRASRFDAHHPIGWKERFVEKIWQNR